MKESAVKTGSFKGIDFYFIKADRFKTSSVSVFFKDSLTRENVSGNALLPAVLRRGCEGFPSTRHIAGRLEELYGASFDCGVVKKGECQVMMFFVESVADKYTREKESLLANVFRLLYRILASPVKEGGVFKREYLEQEKNSLRDLIEGRVNDKVSYAVERCLETMCEKEPYGIYEYGSVDDLKAITADSLYAHYLDFMAGLPVDVFVCGRAEDRVMEEIRDLMGQLERREPKRVETGSSSPAVQAGERELAERMDVNQAKISLGFRTNTFPGEEDYYRLLVYNAILGGGVHSKLFQNVRERESLVYYIFSRLEKFKGLLVVSGGTEGRNLEKTRRVILKQMEEIARGNISPMELEAAVRSIRTGLETLKDNQVSMVDFYFSQAVSGGKDTLDSLIEKVERVKEEDVVSVSKKIRLDTVYYLLPK